MSSMLTWALRYVDRLGWPCFPLHHIRPDRRCSCLDPNCDSPGKHPRCAAGVLDATTDRATIREWWTRTPNANIGLAGGPWWALDVDGEDGENSLASLVLAHVWMPEGPIQQSGSGGKHLLFAGDERVGNRQHVLPGLDVRAAGGYIVAAPSNHSSGGTYRWLRAPSPIITAAPPWLIELVARPIPRNTSRPPPPPVCELGSMAKRAECYIAAIEGGERHCGQGVSTRTFRVAQALVRRFQLPQAEAFSLLRAWADAHCSPRWTDRELEHKIRQAAQQGQMRFGVEDRPRR